MRVLLVSTYDLGRQPFGLASPAAWLRRAGETVDCVDTSREPLPDDLIRTADMVAFYLPMHTATRLAGPLVARVHAVNPSAHLAAYGLYAPLNAGWLREQGVATVLGPEAEAELVAIAQKHPGTGEPGTGNGQRGAAVSRLHFIQPDRSSLPPLERYAALQMPDGSRRLAGSTDATRGCKHLCRHCPIVPVYRGTFRVVPVDVVLADVAAQVGAGAQHISFGDPDFFNGPTHARRLVERLASEFPGLTYDVTIKIEHLLSHADLVPVLRETGCLFITSAVESIDDAVLARLRKGHTRADFVRALDLCRSAGLALSPTFVPFTPWTTVEGYVELLEELDRLGLAHTVAPIQLAIRLLVTAESALLELPDVRERVDAFDPLSLTWPWRHRDPRVDALQREVMQRVASAQGPRGELFAAVSALARNVAGSAHGSDSVQARVGCCATTSPMTVEARVPPHMTEAWYCCAEPV